MNRVGFTNRLAIYCICLITIGLFMAFALALESIKANYQGALACFTVVFTPIGSMLGITLTATVQKSKAENTEGGVNYLKAEYSEKDI